MTSSAAAMTPRLRRLAAGPGRWFAAKACWPASDGWAATGGCWLTGTIDRRVSISVNLDHASCQPPGFSGHHSSGCAWEPPAGQIP